MSRVVSETKVVFFDVATDDSTHVTTRQTKVPSGGFDPLTGVQEIVDNVLFYYHGGPLFFPTDLYMSENYHVLNKCSLPSTYCLVFIGFLTVYNWLHSLDNVCSNNPSF